MPRWAGRVVVAVVVSGEEECSLHNCLLPWVVTWPYLGGPTQQASAVTSSGGGLQAVSSVI